MHAQANRPKLEAQTAALPEALRRELQPEGDADPVTALGRHHFERLLTHATITDYIPLLVYRSTKEDLLHGRLEHTAEPGDEARSTEEPVPTAA